MDGTTETGVAVFIRSTGREEETGVEVVSEMLASGLAVAQCLTIMCAPHVDLDGEHGGVVETTDTLGEDGAAGGSVVWVTGSREDARAFWAINLAGALLEEEALAAVVRVSEEGEVGAGLELLAFPLARILVMGVGDLGQDGAGG